MLGPSPELRYCNEIYLYDRNTGVTVPVTGAETSSTGDNTQPQFTADSRYCDLPVPQRGPDLGPGSSAVGPETGTTAVLEQNLPEPVVWSRDRRWRFESPNGDVTATDLTTGQTDVVLDNLGRS